MYFLPRFILSVYRRRTDNTMAKRKSTKGQTTINITYPIYKTEDRVTHEPYGQMYSMPQVRDEIISVIGKVFLTMGHQQLLTNCC
jgi:hypothetical protein